MFRFTIRDVLWLTVVVALAFGWGLSQYANSRDSQRMRESLEKATRESQTLRHIANQLEDLYESATGNEIATAWHGEVYVNTPEEMRAAGFDR